MRTKDIFLVAYYHTRPKDPRRTKEAGYITNPDNINYEESINITRGLKYRDETTAGVILNLSQQQVARNTFKSDADFASLLGYFQKGYPKYINPIIEQLYAEELNEVHVPDQEKETG